MLYLAMHCITRQLFIELAIRCMPILMDNCVATHRTHSIVEALHKRSICIFTDTVKTSLDTEAHITGTTLLHAEVYVKPLHESAEAVYTGKCFIIGSVVEWLGNSSVDVFQIRPLEIVFAARIVAWLSWAA